VATPTLPDEVWPSLRYAAALSAAFGIISGNPADGVYCLETQNLDLSFVLEVGDSAAVRDGVDVAGTPVLRGNAVTLLEALSVRVPMDSNVPNEWLSVLNGLTTAFESDR
jgi:hypothetical protein